MLLMPNGNAFLAGNAFLHTITDWQLASELFKIYIRTENLEATLGLLKCLVKELICECVIVPGCCC